MVPASCIGCVLNRAARLAQRLHVHLSCPHRESTQSGWGAGQGLTLVNGPSHQRSPFHGNLKMPTPMQTTLVLAPTPDPSGILAPGGLSILLSRTNKATGSSIFPPKQLPPPNSSASVKRSTSTWRSLSVQPPSPPSTPRGAGTASQ